MKTQAESTINNHALYAAGGGLIPIPIIDFMAVSSIQVDLVQNLCEIYNVNFYKNQGKSAISALVGTSLASLGSSLIKAIPGIGSFLGGVSMSILSGATTYAIGQVFAKHFESGGTMEDLNVEDFSKFYKQKLEEGKQVVKDSMDKDKKKESKETEAPKSNSRQDILQTKLEDVKRLFESGIITKVEYDDMRKNLFDEYIG
ncbi:MAG: hypothetical protein ACJAUH_001141 [Saprospiraceae bacterium]|jgi:uncharacterized protein (DUF697 family)